MMTNAKGGIMAEEGAFKDSRRAESEWAKPDSITWLKSGALSGQRPLVEPKPIAKYPEGLDRLMEFAMSALPQTSGLNLELMGLADRVQAGVVEAQRKQSAMAIIAWAFDAMRRYYRSVGRQQARYVIDYVPEGTLVLINGEQSKQYVPVVKSQMAFKFDVIVDEAPTSANMKERVWMVLENIIPALIKAGIKIPPEVLDYSPLPTDLAQKWKQTMQPSPEEQAAQKRQQEAQIQEAEGEAKVKHTEAELNKAQAAKALADANMQPMDQNTEVQGEIAKEQIKAQSSMQIEQMKAQMTMAVEKMKAELKASVDLQIAQMETAVMARMQQQQMGNESALQREEMANKSALESQRIKSQERIGKAKAKSKPQSSK
jgi:chemotaxis protein histidine kinase CheA